MTTACLFIHGFGGSPYETEPLYTVLEECTDWELRAPILPGHDENESLENREYMEWVSKAEKELEDLLFNYNHVYVIGYSMGGVIAAYLATKYNVEKLVLLSTSAHYIDVSQLAEDIWKMAKDAADGDLFENDLFQRYARRMGTTPMSASIEFQKLVDDLRPYFSKVDVPTLVLQGGQDGLLPPKSAEYIYDSIQCEDKTLHFLPQSKHMLCHGPEQKDLIQACRNFLEI
ncbi:alpha/beta hydrolase [Halobacillus salinus]|uniref:Alpha/beta fold hydrolase n=1 Tax=Halobacillus salinus TaxID=192814 RepID=A0A4Z0GX55_9BACI|nr:alpha/beta fold hydrolase [Halobacillus salinus]TGB01963.1 alpha/beta fold hydrolase [Halobacillus salinus]